MKRVWKLKKRTLTLDRPLVMGILNVTPDSFSDGGRFYSLSDAFLAAEGLQRVGADIIDVGGQSTRPGYVRIPPAEEWARLEQLLPAVTAGLVAPVSIDTFYPNVADRALGCGAEIINDVTGFDDPEMRAVAAKHKCGCVLMHCADITDRRDAVSEVRKFFERRVRDCTDEGIDINSICLDLGIGFGKTRLQELELLRRIEEIRVDKLPVLVALSRKRLTAAMAEGAGMELPPAERDSVTACANAAAIMNGADIIRVHNVVLGLQSAYSAASIRDNRFYSRKENNI